jgi:uncharacterized protein YceH (UPF0502 family)
METPLDLVEARVLACLVEKSIVTPEYYPLTLNALTAACNQKSNRDPAMAVSDKDVVRALDSLKERKLAWSVTLAGSRTLRYRHSLTEVLPLPPTHVAVLCELMLRGPQTIGELRARAARMADFADAAAVQAIVQELAARPEGALVMVLPRQPGRREERYTHLLCGAPPAEAQAAAGPAPEPARLAVMAENERLAALEAKVTVLEDELARLTARFADFERQLR